MGADRPGLLNGAAVVEVGSDAGGPKDVAADVGWEAGVERTPLRHVKGVSAVRRYRRPLG